MELKNPSTWTSHRNCWCICGSCRVIEEPSPSWGEVRLTINTIFRERALRSYRTRNQWILKLLIHVDNIAQVIDKNAAQRVTVLHRIRTTGDYITIQVTTYSSIYSTVPRLRVVVVRWAGHLVFSTCWIMATTGDRLQSRQNTKSCSANAHLCTPAGKSSLRTTAGDKRKIDRERERKRNYTLILAFRVFLICCDHHHPADCASARVYASTCRGSTWLNGI